MKARVNCFVGGGGHAEDDLTPSMARRAAELVKDGRGGTGGSASTSGGGSKKGAGRDSAVPKIDGNPNYFLTDLSNYETTRP